MDSLFCGDGHSNGSIVFSIEPGFSSAKRSLYRPAGGFQTNEQALCLLYSVSINLSRILLDQLGLLGRPRGLARA